MSSSIQHHACLSRSNNPPRSKPELIYGKPERSRHGRLEVLKGGRGNITKEEKQ
ncbi:hypothetical protein BaRGS_00000809, partial [Batillaria attramentaria]